jgi:hypothetical protein
MDTTRPSCQAHLNIEHVRDLLVNQVRLERLKQTDNFTIALVITLFGAGCNAITGPWSPA